ncbi:hypothetical protein BJY01DRAFT_245105 [Aspergillus pseudoustus]|uniref:PARP catalytic domain-containing protein n=1 Tax=Aspergillus pseudoustus TaxID=1810923 RepID=A0ABR4KFV7_9EURO
MFKNEWRHPNTKGKLVSIYVVKNAKDPKLKLRFHGTQRACRIGAGSLDPCDNDECYICSILKKGFSTTHANPRGMFGPGIYSSIVSSKADIYARNHHIRSHKHVIILCGVDLGHSVTMKVAGLPPPCDSVEGATKPEGGQLEYPETIVYDGARIKPIGLVVDTPPEKHPLPVSPVDEDIPMADADALPPRDEPGNGRATMPLRQVQVIERRSVDTQSDVFRESYPGPRSEYLQDDGPPRRATLPPSYEDTAPAPTVQQPLPPAPTETIVELSQLDRQTPFAKKVEHLFYDSWTDQYKRPHFETIFLFDIKSVAPRADGQTQARPTPASKDVALLSSLIELPLSFHGARRACYVGDSAYPLNFCRSTKCSICLVFRNQLALREAQVGFTLGHNIFASPSSSQADAFATNHHIRSSQHAMILCACPSIAQANAQPATPGAPPPYSATTFTCEIVVPIGLIMYTRRGWQPL